MTSDRAGHWHYQLDSYQMKLQVYRPWIPSVLEVLGWGFDQALPGEEEDEEARIAQMSSPTSAWDSQVVAWRSSDQRDRRPALLPRRQRLRAGLGFDGRGWITSESPEIPAAAELDELKELYKKKKPTRLWNMTKHKRVATCHIDSRVQKSCRHYMHTYSESNTLSYIVCTHDRAASIQTTQIQTHTSIIALQYKRWAL